MRETLSTEEGGAPPPLRHNTDYLLLWSGQAISVTGSSTAGVAFPLLVLFLTRSAFQYRMIMWGGEPLGRLIGGALIQAFGPRVALGAMAGGVVSIAMAATLNKELRAAQR